MIIKRIKLDNDYYVDIVGFDTAKVYMLGKGGNTLYEAYNRDKFLLGVKNKGVKLSNMEECLIASY